MSYGFLDIAMTPSVRAAQAAMGVGQIWQDFNGHRAFDPDCWSLRFTVAPFPITRLLMTRFSAGRFAVAHEISAGFAVEIPRPEG